MEKVCKACGKSLPKSEFYKTGWGYDCKCKNCRKKRIRELYLEKCKSEDFVEKERARGREKYKRLGYKDKHTNDKKKKESKYTSLRNAKRDFHSTISSSVELHHWNYNLTNSVIAMDRRLHHRLHTNITLDLEEGIYLYNNEKLDTIDKHMNVIKVVCEKEGFDYSAVSILQK